MYYSENGEDFLAFSLWRGQPPGFFVEVGAFDGCYLSNTLALEEAGWRGICVEPHPLYYEMCRLRRQAKCIRALVGAEDKPAASLWMSYSGMLSSGGAGRALTERDYYGPHHYAGWARVELPQISLNSLFAREQVDRVDFLSVDVEGAELEVLAGLDWGRWRPWLLCVELSTPGAARIGQDWLQGKGFYFARRLSSNYLFCRSPEMALQARSLEVRIPAEERSPRATHPLAGVKFGGDAA